MNSRKLTAGRIAVAIACLLSAGCNDSGNPLTKVAGKVLFNGGPPPKPGRIAFQLVAGTGKEGLSYRPGSATFGADGQFVATTFQSGDGLLPGKYEVRIICIDGLPGLDKSFDEVSLVPPGWAPEELVITGDENSVTVEYDVPPKKPRGRKG